MKKLFASYILMMIIVFTIPIAIISCFRIKSPEIVEGDGPKVKVFDCSINDINTLDLEEYIVGVVAAEMPANFHIEALKAQALAARTYTLMRLNEFGGSGCINHPGADICTDSTHCQAYKNPELLGKGKEKILEAVYSTKGEVIVYEDHLIDAVFHSTSGGKTENSEDVWSNKVPYLRSVISEFENKSPKLVSLQKINITDFLEGLKALDRDLIVDKNKLASEMDILERSEGGRVLKLKVGNKFFTGRDIRERFGLNSTNFTFDIGRKEITFTVIGYGHGIGMSQYGADGMAHEGFDYREIIRHYYQETEIINIESFN